MAWQVPVVGTSTNVNLTTADSLYVAAPIVLSGGVSAAGSNHAIIVDGVIASSTGAYINYSSSAGLGNSLTVNAGGVVRNFTNAAVAVFGPEFKLTNAGFISGQFQAVAFLGNDPTRKMVVNNSGTMESDGMAIARYWNGQSTFSAIEVNNTGTIKGGVFAIGTTGGNYSVFEAAGGIDKINNSGSIIGGVHLAGGHDVYSGASGRLSGKVLAGAGNDKVIGGIDGNEFQGGTGKDTLTGNGGNDTLKGDAGNDILNGGLGLDKLYGGANADIFIFNVAPAASNRDTIYDFNHAADTIQLDNADFTGIGSTGTLSAAAFKLGTQATDADDRIIYNKATGHVYYDHDGAGGAAAIHIATLANKPIITHADFVVI